MNNSYTKAATFALTRLNVVALLIFHIAPFACAQERTAELPIVHFGATAVDISQWRALGPFQTEAGTRMLDYDFLQHLGISEINCTSQQFVKICSKPSEYRTAMLKIGLRGLIRSEDWEKYGINSGSNSKCVYLGCEIDAEHESDAWLMVSSVNGAEILLNRKPYHIGKRVQFDPGFDKTIHVRLLKGPNFLLVKTSSFALRIEPSLISATHTAFTRSRNLIIYPLIDSNKAIELISSLPEEARVSVKIYQRDNEAIYSCSNATPVAIPIVGFKEGLYHLAVDLYGDKAEQNFYVGKLDDEIKKLESNLRTVHVEGRIEIDIDTLLQRLKILHSLLELKINSDSSAAAVLYSDHEREATEIIDELMKSSDLISENKEPFKDRPGLHVRGYRSRIDDQIQQYRLFVPSNYRRTGSGLPLVIVPATVFTKSGPFIASVFLSSSVPAHTWTKTAEALGIGILWPGYRIRPYGNPADLAHMDEVLEAVANDYNIDISRIYLCGICSGGLIASMDAIRHPRRYAAIAFEHPVLHRVKNRWDDLQLYSRYGAYREWLHDTDPVDALASLRNVPIWIVHDLSDPAHGPLEDSLDFVKLADRYGNNPRFDRITPHTVTDDSIIVAQLKWLATHHLQHPRQLTFPGQPANGPVSRVFAERFIVVRGTLGNSAERRAADQWFEDFCDSWRSTNYGPCRVINDCDLNPAEEVASNLILIGNEHTNAIWSRLANKLPVKLSSDAIAIRGERWVGSTLAIEAWSENPDVPTRKIALIGANDLNRARVGTMELALDGWFDFAIWSKSLDKPRLLQAGRYAEMNSSE